jgi:hypothetical protein
LKYNKSKSLHEYPPHNFLGDFDQPALIDIISYSIIMLEGKGLFAKIGSIKESGY